MDEEDAYDDFGNYIGGGGDGGAEAEEADDASQAPASSVAPTAAGLVPVLHHERVRVASASDAYGADVEVVVAPADAAYDAAAVAPVRDVRRFEAEEPAVPLPRPYGLEMLRGLLGVPGRVRSVAVVGAIHHGKTSLVDMLLVASHATLSPTHFRASGESSPPKEETTRMALHMDRTDAERMRRTTLRTKTASVLLASDRGPCVVLNVADTPGHAELIGDAAAAMAIADGVLLVVDAAEGATETTRRLAAHAVRRGLRVVLVLTKVERLIVELRLPPADAYAKLRHTVACVNTAIAGALGAVGKGHTGLTVSPLDGSVLFASAAGGWIFSLRSFAAAHVRRVPGCSDCAEVAARLWGDWVLDKASGTLVKQSPGASGRVSFVQLVLEPLYKVHGLALSGGPEAEAALRTAGVRLPSDAYALDARPLLRRAMAALLCGRDADARSAYADMLGASLVPAICERVPAHRALLSQCSAVIHCADDTRRATAYVDASREPLRARLVRLVPRLDGSVFDGLVRVDAGVLRPRSSVLVLPAGRGTGRSGSFAPRGRPVRFEIGGLVLAGGRDRVPLEAAPAGAWVLVPGLDVCGCAALVDASSVPVSVDVPDALFGHCIVYASVRGGSVIVRPSDGVLENGSRLKSDGTDAPSGSTAPPDAAGDSALPDSRSSSVGESWSNSVGESWSNSVESKAVAVFRVAQGMTHGTAHSASAHDVCGDGCVAFGSHRKISTACLDENGHVVCCSVRCATVQADECVSAPAMRVSLEALRPRDGAAVRAALARTLSAHAYLGAADAPHGVAEVAAPGEFALDVALYALRREHGNADVRVSAPAPRLRESCLGASRVVCGASADVPGGAVRVSAIATPLPESLVAALEAGEFASHCNSHPHPPHSADGWDALAAHSVVALGPDRVRGPCVLLDDTLECSSARLLAAHRAAVVAGFLRAVSRGPLVCEPVHGVCFRVVSVSAVESPHDFPAFPLAGGVDSASGSADAYDNTPTAHSRRDRRAGSVAEAAARALHSALLCAAPALLEPYVAAEVRVDSRHVPAVRDVLSRRRGHVVSAAGVSATPHVALSAVLPLTDAVGFDADVRLATSGSAYAQAFPCGWRSASGDPLAAGVRLVPLERAPAPILARDLFVKSRRRRRMPDALDVTRHMDAPSRDELLSTAGL